MNNDEFLAQVRQRGEYADRREATQVTGTVLQLLSRRIPPGEAKDLAAQLPEPLRGHLDTRLDRGAATFGVHEFLRLVADGVGGRPDTARWDASAVLSTLGDSISGGELNQLISQLPSGYAELFGKPELSH